MSPNIEYLELFALAAAVLTWGPLIKNKRVTIFCDNMAVVNMINNITSSCKNCLFLLRLLVLNNLVNNRRIYARHVRTEKNELADALSHLQFNRFWRLALSSMNKFPDNVSDLIWPASKIWNKVPQNNQEIPKWRKAKALK